MKQTEKGTLAKKKKEAKETEQRHDERDWGLRHWDTDLIRAERRELVNC